MNEHMEENYHTNISKRPTVIEGDVISEKVNIDKGCGIVRQVPVQVGG